MNGEQWYEIDDIQDLDIAETDFGISQEHIVMGNGVADYILLIISQIIKENPIIFINLWILKLSYY